MARPVPAALTVSQIVLRLLVILNWAYAAVVAAILVGLITAAVWTMTALGVPPTGQSTSLVMGMRLIAALGLAAVPLNLIVLRRLIAIVKSVRAGDPFVSPNAARLQAIAWAVLGQNLLQLVVGTIASLVSTPAHPLRISAFSTSGWLAVILLFVLARVFSEGTRMRDELEGTV